MIVQQCKTRQLSLLSKYLQSLGVGVGALPNCIINSSSSFSIIFKISDSHLTAFSTFPLCTSNSTYRKLNSPFLSHPFSFCIFATLFFVFSATLCDMWDQTHTPCIGNTVFTTGPPGKSPYSILDHKLSA